MKHSPHSSDFSSVYDVLHSAILDGAFPGCAFGVLQNDDVLLLDGLGRQTYEPESPLIRPYTVYDLASLTKVLATTPMAMLLYQRQILRLDQPLVDILPEFIEGVGSSLIAREGRAQVTLRHLLTHSSGLAAYARLFDTAHNREEILEACLHMPLQHAPGTYSEYSDIGFILLGRALEVLANESIESFCRREIFSSLGMGRTFYLPGPGERLLIPPTENDLTFRRKVVQGEVQDENCWVMGGISGHAGLFGDVADLLTFAHAWLSSWRSPADTTERSPQFEPKAVRLFSSRSNLPSGSSRALGWDTPSVPSSSGRFFGGESIGHLGYAGTSLWIDRLNAVAVVLLTNRTWPSRDNQKIRQIRPIFHDRVRESLMQVNTNVG